MILLQKERLKKVENKVKVILKEEKGAASLLVFITILAFVIILAVSYFTLTGMRKSQLESNRRVQQIYGRDVNRVDEIYNEIISKDGEKFSSNVVY